jgi:hypothetical protein
MTISGNTHITISQKCLRLIIALILFSVPAGLFAQHFPTIVPNGFKSNIIDFITSNKKLQVYDFILIQSEDSYWYKSIDYRLVCFKNNRVDLIKIYEIKKNNRFKIDQINQTDFNRSKNLIDSLTSIGLFDLKKDDLNSEKVDINGNGRILNISDGISKTFELTDVKNLWGLTFYESEKFYEFSKNKNILIGIQATILFNNYWSKKY